MLLNKHIEDFSTHFEEKVFSQTCKGSGGGSDTPAKYMTDNLLKTTNGNDEEQQHTYVGMHTFHMYMVPITDLSIIHTSD